MSKSPKLGKKRIEINERSKEKNKNLIDKDLIIGIRENIKRINKAKPKKNDLENDKVPKSNDKEKGTKK